ncbi:ArsS family sensor histidine kinase [Sulfurospirillum sp. 1612]|uniref:ArsS family sensor histidine kinase n=1 Tax=Sulfurospirillum sp. 1612 TaxID=3094835 RepID=UPI002F95A590
MNRNSIFYSITFIFIISIASIILAFMFLMDYDKQNYTEKLNNKYTIIARATLFHLNNFITKKELENQVEGYNMKGINNKKDKEKIIKNAQVLQKIVNKIGTSSILYYEKQNYLLIEHDNTVLLLKDNDYQPYRYHTIRSIFALILLIIITAYILTIRKIKPLRKLKREMNKFAQGDLQIYCATDGEDEISQVANSFQNAVDQINKLNKSRQLFLRNIMHELKTPITKGRISVEMIDNNKQKQRLISVFEKLELLINEFASIEQITSGEGVKNVKPYRLSDIIDEAIDLAMISDDQVTIDIDKNYIVHVDFRLFTTAIKNIIDNGIKHSIDKQVSIKTTDDEIIFISQGNPLKYDLSHYTEPFTQGEITHKSFGLGLYIVSSIISAHKLEFKYEHRSSQNYFSFNKISRLF